MEKKNILHFSTNAKLGKLIGRELITNNTAAVFELIKNSYDAFATEVVIELKNFDLDAKSLLQTTGNKNNEVISNEESEIVISDNGIGMTIDEIKNNWMVIGTTNKENVVIWERTEKQRKLVRTINGEKGIGRFGCDRLGSKLKMISVGSDKEIINTILIDWDLFDNHYIRLEDIGITAISEENTHKRKTGLELRISSLRDQWTRGDIKNLYRQLKRFISPFKQEESDFSIAIKIGDYLERIKNDSLEYAASEIQGSIAADGSLQYRLTDRLSSNMYQKMVEAPSFGPIEFRILYLDANAKRQFHKNNGISSREYGNIKLFRDNFRILPYGEVENDWLGIDNKHAQSVFRTLGTRDIMGYVQISKTHNTMLKDATNRQGLNEDSKEFADFKNFIWLILSTLQKYVFSKIKEDAEKQGKAIGDNVQEIKKGLQEIRTQIPKWRDETKDNDKEQESDINHALGTLAQLETSVSRVEKASDQMSQRLIVMEKMVGTETMLYGMLHSIKNRMDSLRASAERIILQAQKNHIEIDYKDFNENVECISKIVLAALKRTSPSKGNKKHEYLDELILRFVNEQRLVYPEIEFLTESMIHRVAFCNVDDIRNVLDNLLSNSRKAFREGEKKTVRISMNENEHNNLQIFFEDNGNGIKDEIIPYIFNVSFTRTGGTGIGLSNCLEIMRECKGDISYVKNSSLGGACFVMTFPSMEDRQ